MARRLSNWLDSYLHYTRYDESPESFHRWTALVMLSAAVNRNCWMERGYYRTFPNLYVLFVGPSGIGKSSSSGIGIELLKSTPLQVHIFKDFITPAALIEFMQHSTVSVEIGGKLIHKTPVTIYASELGTLLNPRSGLKELVLLLTELFNKQGDHEDRTGKRGKVIIRRPNLTFLGCCIPEWLDEELISVGLRSGFFGRMLVIPGHSRRHSNANIRLSILDEALQKDLIADLEAIGSLYGEMQWTPEAQLEWDKWYGDLPIDLSTIEDTFEVKGFASRKAQFVQRLAMLSCVSKKDPLATATKPHRLLVDIEDLNYGQKLVRQCEENTRNLKVKPIHVQVVEKLKLCILKLQKKKGDVIAIRDITMLVYRTIEKRALDDGIVQLCDIGFCELIGRKIKILNPKAGD